MVQIVQDTFTSSKGLQVLGYPSCRTSLYLSRDHRVSWMYLVTGLELTRYLTDDVEGEMLGWNVRQIHAKLAEIRVHKQVEN